jgi:hypothetical protein
MREFTLTCERCLGLGFCEELDAQRHNVLRRGKADPRDAGVRGSFASVKIKEDVAVTFINRNLSDRGLAAWREDERFRAFRDLLTDNKPIAAAEEYKRVTGADLPESHLAVTLAVVSRRATNSE